MQRFSLSHVPDAVLLRELSSLVTRDRATTAVLLAHIAEVEARRLYLPKAYSSMFEYCVLELRLSRDEAFKRLRVARMARRFPSIFEAISDGRLHVSSVLQLRGYLHRKNADELLAAAANKS